MGHHKPPLRDSVNAMKLSIIMCWFVFVQVKMHQKLDHMRIIRDREDDKMKPLPLSFDVSLKLLLHQIRGRFVLVQ